MQTFNQITFIKSTLDWRDRPRPNRPEFAFVGRSNVGKSSLVNALVGRKNLARVSKQPGKTRTINYFDVDERFYLVDLPGYGFAKISRSEQQTWQKAIEGYLLNNPDLAVLFVLIDGKVGPKSNDLQLLEWLAFNKVPVEIIATKIDKVPRTHQERQRKMIAGEIGIDDPALIWLFSAKTQQGRGGLTGRIGQLLKSG